MSLENVFTDYEYSGDNDREEPTSQPKETANLVDATATKISRSAAKRLTKEQVAQQLYKNFSRRSNKPIFKEEMKEKELLVQLFLLEGGRGFRELSPRAKFKVIVRRSSIPIQEWYFELSIDNKIPIRYQHPIKIKLYHICQSRHPS